jgi:hypothetical protein
VELEALNPSLSTARSTLKLSSKEITLRDPLPYSVGASGVPEWIETALSMARSDADDKADFGIDRSIKRIFEETFSAIVIPNVSHDSEGVTVGTCAPLEEFAVGVFEDPEGVIASSFFTEDTPSCVICLMRRM